MAIVGLGTDIVEIQRLDAVFRRHGEQFKNRILTEKELELASARHHALEFYAGRWAAKEACAKALGCGIGAKCKFTDIEILNDDSGAPQISLHGEALETLRRKGGCEIHLSISHERCYAVAMVVIS